MVDSMPDTAFLQNPTSSYCHNLSALHVTFPLSIYFRMMGQVFPRRVNLRAAR
jgi:hypothetical protein